MKVRKHEVKGKNLSARHIGRDEINPISGRTLREEMIIASGIRIGNAAINHSPVTTSNQIARAMQIIIPMTHIAADIRLFFAIFSPANPDVL